MAIEMGYGTTVYGTITVEDDGTFSYTGMDIKKLQGYVEDMRTSTKASIDNAAMLALFPVFFRKVLWARPVESSVKFNPHHDQAGRFASGPGMAYAGMGILSSEQQGAIEARMKKMGIDMQTGVDTASTMIEHAKESGVYDEAKNWYVDAHEKAVGMAKATGYTEEQAAGMIAAMSPQVHWNRINTEGQLVYPNLEQATTIAWALKIDATVEINQGLVDGLMKYDKYTNFSNMLGQKLKLSQMTPDQAGYVLKPLVQAYPANVAKAVRIARGEAPADVLGGAKVRSFYSNLMWPKEPSGVTVDTWMIRTLTGRKDLDIHQLHVLITSPSSNGLKGIGSYPYMAEMLNTVAKKYNILPQEAQAIVWTQSRREEGRSNVSEIEGI